VLAIVSIFGALLVTLLDRSLADRARLMLLSATLEEVARTDPLTGLLSDIGLLHGVRFSVDLATAIETTPAELVHAADVALYDAKAESHTATRAGGRAGATTRSRSAPDGMERPGPARTLRLLLCRQLLYTCPSTRRGLSVTAVGATIRHQGAPASRDVRTKRATI
jgi:hypothetical protein